MTIKILHAERQGLRSQAPAPPNTAGIVSLDAQCECGEIWESTKLGRGSTDRGGVSTRMARAQGSATCSQRRARNLVAAPLPRAARLEIPSVSALVNLRNAHPDGARDR
jgi:hypothetical protein